MNGLYTTPMRVYITLGAFALWGILSGLQLPVSLFPNSSQVTVGANVPTGIFSAQQFYDAYGRELESQLQNVKVGSSRVKELRADYHNHSAQYQLQFEWGTDPEKAVSEVTAVINTRFASSPEEVRRGIQVYTWSENRGFFAVSFYSPMRSLDELYGILEPMVTPLRAGIEDAGNFGLWNPNRKEITVSLIPEKLAQYEVTTQQVQRAINASSFGLTGGSLRVGENDYLIDLPKTVDGLETLERVRVSPRGAAPIFLKDVARISSGISKDSRQKFKTSGVESLILFADPKEGGNIKRMADQIMAQMAILEKSWPSDVQYKILVNPSEFINRSISNVVHEVFLAAFLAVVVLFLFIGSFRNVITAAIEIPLSLLMAFILMRLTGMNLNLISLGGLALSAGMNVDASVVVLENIVRHFEMKHGPMSAAERAQTVFKAVEEVRLPIIASTLASLVVFLPLIFTQGLTHSLLGDLAKAVIFSHGLSAVVALVLVPTIRLHLMSKGIRMDVHSPVEPVLRRLESLYRRSLEIFLDRKGLQLAVFGSVILLLPLLVAFVLPRLKKEVIGKPLSDWLIVGISSPTFSTVKQMESELDELEGDLNARFGSGILYTFTQINGPNNGNIMIRLADRHQITEMVQKADEIYKNTPTKFYFVDQWNPSELEIPDPPNFQLEVVGGDARKRLQVTQDLQSMLTEKGFFDKVRVTPTASNEKEIRVLPYLNSGSESEVMSRQDLAHYLRVATDGVYADRIFERQQEMPIYLRLRSEDLTSLEQLKALPVGFEGRLIPLSALAALSFEERPPRIYQVNQRALSSLRGRVSKSQIAEADRRAADAREAVKEIRANLAGQEGAPVITEVQPDAELQESLTQLKWAVGISIGLVFLTMVLQLGEVMSALLVLVAIPLGFIGVLLSLFVFQSSLSLNSGLGTILLNGIAVANSIILVDFIRKLHREGKDPRTATLEAAQARVRPILMTSLTTVLGMLPVALGLGEGGQILQPLGIAVCGGLWVSTLLTLYLVPALQCLVLSRRRTS